tara:strand:- start:345 stop:566 length:222 start_codon:yes stop_codon:yes gene_type:complete
MENESVSILNTILLWADNIPVWIAAVTGVVTAATAVTALTPTTHDDKVIAVILRVLNFLAGNIFKNRNADDVG